MAAIRGRIFYYNDAMSIYRVNTSQSWTVRDMNTKSYSLQNIFGLKSELNMFFGFAADYPLCKKSFYSRSAFFFSFLRDFPSDDRRSLYSMLRNYCKHLPILWRLFIVSFVYDKPLIKSLFYRLLTDRFTRYYLMSR